MPVLGSLKRLRRRAKQALVLQRAGLLARARGATIDFRVAPDVDFGRRVQFRVRARSKNVVVMGSGCWIDDDVVFLMEGGRLELGPRVEIRRGSVLKASGDLRLEGRNVLSYQSVFHCADSIFLGECSSVAEYVSVIDSTHLHDGPEEAFYDNMRSAPIHIGRNTWVGSKATVLMGVRIGHNSVIAAHAVVSRDVGDGVVAGGIPAKEIAKRQVAGPALAFFDQPVG